jgi:1-deoxy-D-xylulose-5-phosphate reductoisomerase
MNAPSRPLPGFPRRVAILGATGSIGEKALSVAERYPDRLRVTALAAHGSVEPLAAAARRCGASHVAVADAEQVPALRALLPAGTRVDGGPEAVAALAALEDVDVVLNGIMGRAGLEASLLAAERGKLLALANKESMVLAGELIMRTARAHGARVIPVDSEHSGLFQCLDGRDPAQVKRLIITASGGPFRGKRREELVAVTPQEALRHPIWPMGARITVDSATLFNKGLEVIETQRLFDVPLDRIDVWVHPQSVIHALVELTDGAMIAQLSAPDMLIPVQYAMSYPERWECAAPVCDLPRWGSLGFEAADLDAFPALRLAYRAAERGGTAPAVLNAADEVAVEAFLDGRLRFPAIAEVVEEVLDRAPSDPADSLGAVIAADRAARAAALEAVAARRL